MSPFTIVLFSFTLALHLFILEATHYSIIALLGRPTSWEADYHLEVDYDTCCQEMCRANESCKSYDQIWQPSRDIYECRFYSKNYQVLKAEGEKLELIPRVQYYSKMYQVTSCEGWWEAGARSTGDYKISSDGTTQFCFELTSCDDVVKQGLLSPKTTSEDFGTSLGESDFQIRLHEAGGQILNVRCANILGKAWTIFQKRMNPQQYPFNKKTWAQFKTGFSDSVGDFYLGNRWMNNMLGGGKVNRLMVLVRKGTEWSGEKYEKFKTKGDKYNYEAVISDPAKPQDSIAGWLSLHLNEQREFITIDRDPADVECSKLGFNGEGYAGWRGKHPDACLGEYWLFPNARVPQRFLPNRVLEKFDASIMMFHHAED
eukprot:TCONS_00025456-protein